MGALWLPLYVYMTFMGAAMNSIYFTLVNPGKLGCRGKTPALDADLLKVLFQVDFPKLGHWEICHRLSFSSEFQSEYFE